MSHKKLLIGLFTASLIGATPTLAVLHDSNNPQLQHRHNVMEIAKYSLLGMKSIITGDIKDTSQFPALANSLANAASISKKMFEEDTRKLTGDTDAKNNIWENWEDFSNRMTTYNNDAQELAKIAAEGDMKRNTIAFKQTVKHCKSCHDEYRQEQKH